MTGRIDDLKASLIFGTRLPMPAPEPFPPLAQALRVFPLAGAILGLAAGAWALLLCALGVPALAVATVAVFVQVLMTGALHEDGLADFADGVGGGRNRESKLAIMRDSRTGTYGVLAVVFAVLARVAALSAILAASPAAGAAALVAAASLSRALPVVLLHRMEAARIDGRSAEAGRPNQAQTNEAIAWGVGLAAVALVPWFGAGALLAGAAVAVACYGVVSRIARKHLGGQTGDVAGACQQVGEIGVLLVLSAFGV